MPTVYQLRSLDGDDLEKWIVSLGDTPFEVVFQNEDVAKRAAELLKDRTNFGVGTFPLLYVFLKHEEMTERCPRCSKGTILSGCGACGGTGRIEVTVTRLDVEHPGGFEDRQLRQVQERIAKEIDSEIGFDRNEACPERGKGGCCEGCYNLAREEITDPETADVVGHRWMCWLRHKEVKCAEKLGEGK